MSEEAQRPSVLIAEDLPGYLDRICGLFSELEIDLVCALNGEEAIAYIDDAACRIDLLITDLDMPIRNGWHVIEALRSGRGSEVPIIMQTGEAAYPWVQSQAKDLGIVLIDKIHVDIRLVNAVREALGLSVR